MIGKIAAISFLLLNTAFGFYKAGKYASGGKDVLEGPLATLSYIIGAILNAILAALLYLD